MENRGDFGFHKRILADLEKRRTEAWHRYNRNEQNQAGNWHRLFYELCDFIEEWKLLSSYIFQGSEKDGNE